MKFEIDETNGYAITIWLDENSDKPNIYQPHWPDGTAWASYEEASNWAQLVLDRQTNPSLKIIPGSGPNQPIIEIQEPTIEQKLENLGLSLDEIKTALGI